MLEQNTGLIQLTSTKLPECMELRLTTPLKKQTQLRNARQIFERSSKLDEEDQYMVRKLCESVVGCEISYADDRAWALYYLGHLELQEAKRSGALQALWGNDISRTSTSTTWKRPLHDAQHHLCQAILWLKNVSDVLHRNILRCLALAVGPTESSILGTSAGMLVIASISQSIRRRMAMAFHRNDGPRQADSSCDIEGVFGTFDGFCRPNLDRDDRIASFLSKLAQRTPVNWKFVASAICPSGEVLYTILTKESSHAGFVISTKCVFPPNHRNAYDMIIKPFDDIMMKVQQQLHGMDASETDDKEAMKRKWWHERSKLDDELCDLLEKVDDTFFFKVLEKGDDETSAGESLDNSISSSTDSSHELPRGNLSSRFDNAVEEVAFSSEKESDGRFSALNKLTVSKLKDKLRALNALDSTFRKVRKKDLVQRIIEEEDKAMKGSSETTELIKEAYGDAESCLFLLLDENLQRFPFEGMPSLRCQTVCRVPCLSFVLATLCEQINDTSTKLFVDPEKASYILDPESNLLATSTRLLPVIQDLTKKHDWHWKGVVGEVPSASFFFEALTMPNGLLLYFGHGGAQLLFSRREVEEMIERRVSNTLDGKSKDPSCLSGVVLMGCSSGKLVSINKKNSISIEQVPLYYEPEGIALSYLCAGAPCVIGNLWDVTDHDIDRCVRGIPWDHSQLAPLKRFQMFSQCSL